MGQWEKIEETEESWSGGDLRVVMEQETIRVEGRVDLGPKAYHFNHLFRERMQESTGAGASLVLEESMVTPKTLDGRYQKALLLAGYLARNKAAYEAAVRAQRPFTVDDSLLKLTRSLVDDF